MIQYLFVFMGERGFVPAGIFSSFETGKLWIEKEKLTGSLNKLPIDIGLYDWAIEKGYFKPMKSHESTPKFIERFSCASVEHWHFEDGVQQ